MELSRAAGELFPEPAGASAFASPALVPSTAIGL
jgi:hypothetical protein